MPRDFFPRRDADVVPWSRNLADKLVADPGAYNVAVQTAADYMMLHLAFAEAQRRAVEPDTRTRTSIVARDAARKALESAARHVCGQIRGSMIVTAAQRVGLGMGPGRRKGSRIARPVVAPHVIVMAVCGHRVKLRLMDPASPTRRAKPDGVHLAVLFYCAGEHPPADPGKWRCAGMLSRMRAVVSIDPSIQPGTTIWFQALWTNAKSENGPLGPATSTRVQFDGPTTIRMGRPMKTILRAA